MGRLFTFNEPLSNLLSDLPPKRKMKMSQTLISLRAKKSNF